MHPVSVAEVRAKRVPTAVGGAGGGDDDDMDAETRERLVNEFFEAVINGEDDDLAVTSRLVDVMNEAPPGGAAGGAGRSDAPDSDLELDLDDLVADGDEYMTAGANAGASDANERHTSAESAL